MKYIYALLIVLILTTSVLAVQTGVHYGQKFSFNKVQGAAVTNLQETKPKLGAVGLDIFAYGARDVGGSVNPNTPLEYRVQVSQAVPKSPPVTNAYQPTIFLVVIYNDGSFDTFGTEDVPNIQVSNRFMYDHTLERWVNTKGVSQGNVKGQQRFVGIVSFNGDTKMIQKTVNVR